MSTTSLIILVVALGAAVALAWTNPAMPAYVVFLEGQLNQAIERTDPAAPERDLIRQIFKSRGTRLIEAIVRPNTVRRNYGLFSTFETRALEVRVVVVGVGNTFFPLGGTEEVTLRLGRLIPSLTR